MAELDADQQFQRRKAVRDRALAQDSARWRLAEQPLVEELQVEGVNVETVWDLVNTDTPYPRALPVLIKHLERGGYPDRVTEGIGRALAVQASSPFWGRLLAVYNSSRTPFEEEAVAIALAASTPPERLPDLEHLASDATRGRSRVFFLRPLLQAGGESGSKVVASLRNDPDLAAEAQALLRDQE